MTRKTLQQILGYVVLPILSLVPFVYGGPIQENYTSLINQSESKWLFFLCEIPVFLYSLFLFLKSRPNVRHWKLSVLITSAFLLLTVFTPYHENESFFSSLHLLFAFLSILAITYLMYEVTLFNSRLRNIYIGSYMLAFFITLTFSRINGLAEIPVVLSILIIQTAHDTKQ